MKYTNFQVHILIQKCLTEIKEKLVIENKNKSIVLLFGAANAAQNKDSTLL